MRFVICLFAMMMIGACSYAPRQVSIEADHVSHLTQHRPFSDHPTNFGYTSINVIARWHKRHVYAELSEGLVLNARDGRSFGGLWGPREVFTARLGYIIWSKH